MRPNGVAESWMDAGPLAPVSGAMAGSFHSADHPARRYRRDVVAALAINPNTVLKA